MRPVSDTLMHGSSKKVCRQMVHNINIADALLFIDDYFNCGGRLHGPITDKHRVQSKAGILDRRYSGSVAVAYLFHRKAAAIYRLC